MLTLSKNVVSVLDPPKMNYFWRILHAVGNIFEESEQT